MIGTAGETASSLGRRLASGGIRSADLVRACLERIGALDGAIGAFLHVDGERALADAARIDRRRSRGEAVGPLAGVPVAVKDNIAVEGMPLTCGSRILEGYRAPYDATPVARLRRQGMIVLGKTNLDEFAMGSSGEHSAFGPVRNPLDPGRVAGGSSAGSAAAVAAGMVPVALGSDTGGSLRQPAAFCGLVGLKPTYGRVSRYGLVAFASSLDHVGPIARSVRDAARVLDAIAGPDPRDSTACEVDPPCAESALGRNVSGTRVGVVVEALEGELHPTVRAGVERAVDAARDRGMDVRTLRLPVFSLALPAYYILCTAEAASNLARYDGVRYGHRARAGGLETLYRKTRSAGFGREVKRRILLGTFVLSRGYREAYYRRALRARARVVRAIRGAFEEVDLLMTPTTPAPAFALGERTDDPVEMYRSDRFTGIANLAGVPAVSIPAGRGADLPVGVQLMARAYDEAGMLAVAHALEEALRGVDD